MKSYTDLEQSKRLAEILPLESADMCFNTRNNMPPLMTPYSKFNEFFNMEKTPDFLIPCWSLAALLELLPKRIEIVDNVYELSIYLYGIYYWNTINGNLCFKSKDKDNLVDACYEAIVFLHEQKLL